MPRLPVVDIGRRNLRALNQPEASALDFGAGIGSALTEAGNVFERIQEASDEAEYRRISEQTKAKMEGALKLLDEEQPDPNVYYSQAAGTIEELHKGAVASASNPRVKSAVESSLQPFITRSQTVANLDRRKKQEILARADSLTYLDQAKERLIDAPTPLEQQIIERQIIDHVRTMTATNVLPADKGVELVQRLSDAVDKGRKQKEVGAAYSLAERNPQLLLEKLDAGQELGLLTGPERMAVRGHANSALNAQEQRIKEAERERVEAVNTTMLERNVAGRLTVSDVLASNLPSAKKEHWVDKLTRQQKEASKPKEIDPFAKSDGNTRAMVLEGVLTNPHEWPQERILDLQGRGLSTAHTEHLVKLQKDLTKEKTPAAGTKKYTPLNMTLDTLGDMHKNYFFTKEGINQKVTDRSASAELKIKNDAEYNRIVDEVIRRSEAGEEPRKVAEQLMKPYMDMKTKSYFEQVKEFMFQPLAPPAKALPPPAATPRIAPPSRSTAEVIEPPSGRLRIDKNVSTADRDVAIRAQEELTRRGLPVNAENMKKTVEYLKSKGAK